MKKINNQLEFCIFGWDNLPRSLLIYFTNAKLSQEGTVNGGLRYMIWDNPPKMESWNHFNVFVYDQMVENVVVVATQFEAGDRVLDMIDKKILRCGRNRVVSGAWCSGWSSWWMDGQIAAGRQRVDAAVGRHVAVGQRRADAAARRR
ncbi:Xylosyltransferase 1 [Sesbania bispinosa]|nr:Xylosyltransferase 1 [Sesbania bispinosa]